MAASARVVFPVENDPTIAIRGMRGSLPARSADSIQAMNTTARLLVATPIMADPNFERTVIFILEHTDEGALGVVVNRPVDVPLIEVLPRWALTQFHPTFFKGGPVNEEAAICLARPRPGVYPDLLQMVDPTIATVDLDADPDAVEQVVEAGRIFIGYAGWGPGQLEAELDENAWFVCESIPSDVFTLEPDDLWRAVIRRQGDDIAIFAHFPEDPKMN